MILQERESIPIWIKNIGEYWCTEQINDEDFVNAIQYLLKKQIIEVDATNGYGPTNHQIPEYPRATNIQLATSFPST